MFFTLEISLDSTLTFLHTCVRCPPDPQLLQDFLGVLEEDAKLSFLLTFNFLLINISCSVKGSEMSFLNKGLLTFLRTCGTLSLTMFDLTESPFGVPYFIEISNLFPEKKYAYMYFLKNKLLIFLFENKI